MADQDRLEKEVLVEIAHGLLKNLPSFARYVRQPDGSYERDPNVQEPRFKYCAKCEGRASGSCLDHPEQLHELSYFYWNDLQILFGCLKKGLELAVRCNGCQERFVPSTEVADAKHLFLYWRVVGASLPFCCEDCLANCDWIPAPGGAPEDSGMMLHFGY